MLPIIRVIDPPYGDKIKVRNPDERFKNTILLNLPSWIIWANYNISNEEND